MGRVLAEQHHAAIRAVLAANGGIEQDTARDGFYARFSGPARAIRSAIEAADAVRPLGIEIRAGVHAGECEIVDSKCSGLSVSIGARVMSHAGPSEVLVSQTVKDLVTGSWLTFEDAGEHELKSVPDRWRLYRVGRASPGAGVSPPKAGLLHCNVYGLAEFWPRETCDN